MQKQLPQHSEIVTNDWVDYNGHMNVAYYVLIFDHATDVLMNHISLDQEHRNATGGSMFVVESHIVYEQEVMEGINVEIDTLVLDVDDKRLHLFMTMREAGSDVTAATIEMMILHVDLNTRKSAPFPIHIKQELSELKEQHASSAQPSQIGRKIGIRKA
jgi:acyl-CoA thioester hydrolase